MRSAGHHAACIAWERERCTQCKCLAPMPLVRYVVLALPKGLHTYVQPLLVRGRPSSRWRGRAVAAGAPRPASCAERARRRACERRAAVAS